MIRYLEKSKQRADEEIQKLIDAQCTAIVGTSTMITLDLLNHMQSHAGSMEQNICLCGFADSYLAKRFSDEIPTVDEPIDAMGKRAGEMILEKIADPGVSFPIERISCTYKSNSLQKAP